MWQLEIHTWGRTSGGPGSGLFRSVDGGVTWKRLDGHGLPKPPVGKISAQVARSNSSRVYALIETGDGLPATDGTPTQSGSLWRSDDGGDNWELVSSDRRLRGRTHYYTRFAHRARQRKRGVFLSAEFTKTLDGGKTSIDLSGRLAPIGDNHDMWIDPTNGDRFVVAHDDGLSLSVNRGKSWHQIQLPVAQMYHVAVDNQIPYNVYGNRQDGPSTRGPSNSRLAKQSDEESRRTDSARHVAFGRRRRERLGDSRSGRQQHRLGERHRVRQRRRHGRALRRAHASGARGRNLAGVDHRHRRPAT